MQRLAFGHEPKLPDQRIVALWPRVNIAYAESRRKVSHLNDAFNAKNVAFLLGSGCSSQVDGGRQLGVPTMAPMAQAFLAKIGTDSDRSSMSQADRDMLHETIGLSVEADEYAKNLERLMEVLFSADFVLRRSTKPGLAEAATTVRSVIAKVTRHVFEACTQGPLPNVA